MLAIIVSTIENGRRRSRSMLSRALTIGSI
jgi:hypothetical protein